MKWILLIVGLMSSSAYAKGCIETRKSEEGDGTRYTLTNRCTDARPVTVACRTQEPPKRLILEEGQVILLKCDVNAKITEEEWIRHGS